MADTLKFGPEWLRQLSSGGSMTSPPPSPSFGGKYKLADYRYGREEMLALFHPNAKAPDDLKQFSSIGLLVERCQDPMATIAPTEEEQRLLASNVNSNAAYSRMGGQGRGSDRVGAPGMRGAGRGGGMSTRGRGRGKGDSGFYRGGFDDPLAGRGDSYRGRGTRDGMKVIERDSSGFLSARTFDESTDRRSKDPYSRSMPGDRWSELRTGGERGAPRPNTEPISEQQSSGGTTPSVPDDKDDDWRSVRKDRQPRGTWRDAKPSFDDDPGSRSYPRGGFNRQTSYERSNRNHHRPDDDELPEWANDDMGGGDEGGTFDSSGAFMSLKDFGEGDDLFPSTNGDSKANNRHSNSSPSSDTLSPRKQEIDKARKALPPLKINRPTGATPPGNRAEKKAGTPSYSSAAQGHDRSDPSVNQASAVAAALHSSSVSSNESPARISEHTPSSKNNTQHNQTGLHKSLPKNTANSESAVGTEADADFDHLTKAAEEMMATWAAEDDEQPPAAETPPSMPQVDNPTGAPELADSWFYKDPQGTLQGPFTAQEMTEWFSAGYFTMTLLVKQGKDTTFQPLGEIIKRCGGRQPFIPSTPVSTGMPPLHNIASTDPAILAAQQDPRALQQQVFLLQQQALLQQQQQAALIRQQQQLTHILQTLSQSEEYSKLSQQQLQTIAMSILVKEQQKQQVLLAQQAQQVLLEATRNSSAAVSQQSSPPQQQQNVGGGGVVSQQGQVATPTHIVPQDEDGLWGAANRSWNQQMRERAAVEEIAKKEAARQQEQQRMEIERQQQQQQQRELEVQMMEQQQRQAAAEQRRIQEEKAKLEIQRQKDEMEKQKREIEDRKRQEIERQEMEKQKVKERQLELERQREIERQRQIDLERQREVQLKLEQEAKKQAQIQKQREVEEKKHREAMEAEMSRRAEQQRIENEAVERERERQRQIAEQLKERERQAERERLEALQLPSTAQWGSSNHNQQVSYERQLSLQEIQRREKEQSERERVSRLAAERQRQQEEAQAQQQQAQLKWATAAKRNSPVTAGKSLREIQEEEAIRLEKEKKEKQKKAAALQAASPLGTAAMWGAGKPASVTSGAGWANEGAWGAAAATKKSGWDQPANNKPAKSASNELFPSLSATAKPQNSSPAQQKKKPTSSQNSSSKKSAAQNDKVQKMFQNAMSSQSADDKFTEWCTRALQGLNASIDVPTFVSFLREVESPYEVQDYVKSYLGETAKTTKFANDFIEKRSMANKQRQAQRHEDEENLWGPAPAVNPASKQRNNPGSEQSNAANADKKKKAGPKKTKKMDATALLGFSVGASSTRLNIGEIEKAE